MKKVLIWVGSILLALIVIGAISSAVSGGDDEADAESPPAAATTTPAADPEPTSDPTDTGRFSEGEFDRFRSDFADFTDENQQWADTLGRCSVFAQAGEFAAASACYGEAYSGFETDALVLAQNLRDVEDDTSGKCRIAVRGMYVAVEGYAEAVAQMARAGENLQADELSAASDRGSNEGRRLVARGTTLNTECAPA